ncbi:MAG: GIY-YIG nuclease family protein [Bacteroidales bacterium]|nr:GIY-YIG nuclease family protein [Bacteroidales bacterium]
MENTIKLNSILRIAEQDLWKYKLHLAAYNGYEHPLDVFVKSFEDWKGWNAWRGNKNDFSREFIFALIPDYHRWGKYIFGGVFRVVRRYEDYAETEIGYELEYVDQFKELTGRLVIDFYRYPGMRGRAFRLENYIDAMTVAEILPKPYGGIDFPGYENICIPFNMLELLVVNQKQDWATTLGNVKGIYVISDKANGKQYVGSAYGDGGIWGRWSCYATTGHGYNDELVDLINKKGLDYARENFQFSVLEVMAMSKDDSYVTHRESYWKGVLLTHIPFGYNKN